MESQWRMHLPKVFSDWVAFFFTIGTIHSICLYELFVILPYIDYDRERTFWFHFAAGVFLYINIMGAFYKIVTTDTTSGNIVLPSILKPEWRFCSYCEANAPPRSFHCWICKMCVLKRDHHCVFSGNCIGYSNHRYYMIFIFQLAIAAAYCNYLNMDYTWEVLGGLSGKALFTMIVPLFAWMLGLSETFTFAVALISATCILGFFLVGFLTGYHIMNLVKGQTTHERAKHIHSYNLGWQENMRETFGENWKYAWISPFLNSPLPGNGIEFTKRNGIGGNIFENAKTL